MAIADLLLLLVALLFLAAAAVSDARALRIPNWLTLPVITAGAGALLLRCLGGYPLWLAAIISAASLGLTYLLWLTGSWGGGDSKATLGTFLLAGPVFSSLDFLIAFTVCLALLLAARELWRRALRPKSVWQKRPLGPWLLLTFMVTVTACLALSGGPP